MAESPTVLSLTEEEVASSKDVTDDGVSCSTAASSVEDSNTRGPPPPPPPLQLMQNQDEENRVIANEAMDTLQRILTCLPAVLQIVMVMLDGMTQLEQSKRARLVGVVETLIYEEVEAPEDREAAMKATRLLAARDDLDYYVDQLDSASSGSQGASTSDAVPLLPDSKNQAGGDGGGAQEVAQAKDGCPSVGLADDVSSTTQSLQATEEEVTQAVGYSSLLGSAHGSSSVSQSSQAAEEEVIQAVNYSSLLGSADDASSVSQSSHASEDVEVIQAVNYSSLLGSADDISSISQSSQASEDIEVIQAAGYSTLLGSSDDSSSTSTPSSQASEEEVIQAFGYTSLGSADDVSSTTPRLQNHSRVPDTWSTSSTAPASNITSAVERRFLAGMDNVVENKVDEGNTEEVKEIRVENESSKEGKQRVGGQIRSKRKDGERGDAKTRGKNERDAIVGRRSVEFKSCCIIL